MPCAHRRCISVMRFSALTRGSSLRACTVARAAMEMYLLNLRSHKADVEEERAQIANGAKRVRRSSKVEVGISKKQEKVAQSAQIRS